MKLKLATFGKLALLAALLGAVSIPLAVTQATVSSTAPRNDYVGTGSVSAYDYTFRIFANSDLRVTTQTSAGVVTALTLTTDYTVTGANNPNGGTVTLVAGNLASGTTLTIRSDRTPRQDTNLRNQGSFSASTHETKFDELTRYAQQLRDVVARSIHLPETEVGTDAATVLPSATLRASKFLAFDGSGNTITAAGTSANLGPVSSFIDTLLDDSTAAAARTTLGVPAATNGTLTTPTVTGGTFTQPTALSPIVTGIQGGTAIQRIRKTADESLNTSTTLQDDNHLVLAVDGLEEWVGTIHLSVGAALGDTGIKVAITVPSGATLQVTAIIAGDVLAKSVGLTTTTSGQQLDGTTTILAGCVNGVVTMHFWVLNGATPGNLQLQWAQSTSHGSNVTVRKGSALFAERVA